MREHEQRYRSSPKPGSGRTLSERERYRRANDSLHANKSNRKMTYDEYLKQYNGAEKLIDVSEDSLTVKLQGYKDEVLAGATEVIGRLKVAIANQVVPRIREFDTAQARQLAASLVQTPKKRALVASVGALFIFGVFVVTSGSKSDVADELAFESSTLPGAQPGTTGAVQGATAQNLPAVNPGDYEFDLLVRAGTEIVEYDTVLISPDGADPAYTFIDKIQSENGPEIQVTQQQIPSDFNLKEVAESFQATDVIQIDDVFAYHGFSESSGVQSILFVKGQLLVSVRSPRVLADDTWANYIISLQ